MIKAIFSWTFWQNRWSAVWWSVGVVAFIVLQMAFYPTFRDQQAELEKSLSQLSDSAVALFSDTGDFFSPIGYLSGQIFYVMMPLLMGILAIGIGASLIGREEKEGTLELLLARPISRAKLMLSKSSVGILIVALVGLMGALVTALMAKLVELPVPVVNILLAGLAAVLLAISFGAVAFMVTMLGRGARAVAIGAAALYAIAGYVISSLAQTVDWLKWPAKAFPFDYYRPAEILSGTYDWLNILFILGVILVAAVISLVAFRRRDLSS